MKKSQEALDHFYEALKAVSFGINVQPERLLYTDNRMAYTLGINLGDHSIVIKIQCGGFKECLCLQIYGTIDM